MENEARAKPRAVIIDDAYARPAPDDLRRSLQSLRRFLRDVPAAKDWFDATFGLTGLAQARAYFDPLLHSTERTLELWDRRSECPDSQRLLEEGIPDIVAEVGPLRQPLAYIENMLSGKDWEIVRFRALPQLAEVPADIEMVVIDYVLTPDTPPDMAAKIEESTNFLRNLVERASTAAKSRVPLIILMSSRPAVEKRHAERFRKSVGVQGAYFNFIRKKSLAEHLGPRVDGFVAEAPELESYRRVHVALQKSLAIACDELRSEVDALELQDLAALHVGHLLHEGEPLCDYVAWMLGQALTAKLQQAVALADASGVLPQENHRVLLGHLEPTQGIPKLFCELSSVRTASGEMLKHQPSGRELRFGDVFAGRTGKKIDVSRFLLVISQTCDLLQGKITNGQVLCVEGAAKEVTPTEAELMRATLRQLEEKGTILIRLAGTYYQIEWLDANLLSIEQTRLQKERGFTYVGRLNEIYALEAQHSALNRLGRIGVPVKPGYGMVFGAVRLSVWGAKVEVKALASSFDTKTVVAVLRPRRRSAVAVLMSMDVKRWLAEQLSQLPANPAFPKDLAGVAAELVKYLNSEPDFHFVCKQSSKGVLQLSVTANVVDENTKEVKKETVTLNKLSVVLGGAGVFADLAPPQGLRLQLELDSIA